MSGKKITFYILAAFIVGTITLVYIQYNSSKNVNALVTGDQRLLEEFTIRKNLATVEKNIILLQRNVSSMVATGNLTYIDGLTTDIRELRAAQKVLQTVTDDASTERYVDELERHLNSKISLYYRVVDTFRLHGKVAADALIDSNMNTWGSNLIENTVRRIDSTRTHHLTEVTLAVDENGTNALRLSYILIILILLAAGFLFWYMIHIIRRLIQSEKQIKESARIKENFMANMSHEIRTPLNAILGFTNLLQHQELDGKSREYALTIQKSGENLLTIINDILDLSKIEAGMMRIEVAPFSIRALVHSIETMFTDKAKEKGLQLSTMVDGLVPDILEGDATRLTQILVNLIGNAVKFTNTGKIEIAILSMGIKDKTINVCIMISDTGIGIEQEKLQDIFVRFQQAEDSVTRKYGGSGLGLSIVNELVQLLKGTIRVESLTDKGTTFTVVIPYKISSDPVPAASFKRVSLSGDNFANSKVLVVEDNEVNQSLIKHLFTDWKLPFDIAGNGKKAIELLSRNNTYSLILMDIQMPEMDGYTATQEIRRNLKLDTPIIAMTAHALAGEREKCLSYGMNEYISKPLREEKLHQLISQFTAINIMHPKMGNGTASGNGYDYKYINLEYMKEVSGGNADYEKTVTVQFIEAVSGDLQALANAWKQNNVAKMRQLAHNMKTTVSVMGLNEVLQPHLDALEYETLTDEIFNRHFHSLETICTAALQEAKAFHATL